MNGKLKHLTGVLAFLFAALFLFPVTLCAETASAEDTPEEDIYAVPDTAMASYVYLYNMENDQVIHSVGNLNEQISTNSTVKIMSGIVAIEALGGERTREITLTAELLREAEAASGNRIGLYEGEVVTAEQMLYGMLANSATDAAGAANGRRAVAETYIEGFEGDLYGQVIKVSFLRRIRGEMKFPSVDALKAQIRRDSETARKEFVMYKSERSEQK